MKNAIFTALAAVFFASCSGPSNGPEHLTRADLDSLRAQIAAQIAASTAAQIEETRRAAALIRYPQTSTPLRSVHEGPDAGTTTPDSAPISQTPPTVYEPDGTTRICPDHYTTRDGVEYLVHQGKRGGCYYITDSGAKRYLKK